MSRSAVIVNLGCRLNQADAALMTDRLQRNGYTLVEPGSASAVDLVIINSCAVTATAVSKSRQAAVKYRKLYPDARIIVTGCAVEIDFDKWRDLAACDGALTNVDKRSLETMLEPDEPHFSLNEPVSGFEEHAAGRFPFRHRALVKIQEGCNNFCTYCIVPYTRGPERSRSAEEVLQECEALAAAGIPEIVLTGVNTCAYSDSGYDLGQLVKRIAAIPGDFRIRLSSTEPKFDNLKLLDSLKECGGKVCRFLHLSLQHGSDEILRKMGRKYTAKEYAEFAAYARSLWPDIHLGTDVIVGFPGETDELFNEGVEFVKSMNFANIHIFRYSPRPGTPAAGFPDRVPGEVAKARYDIMAQAAEESRKRFYTSQKGKILPVIFEEEKNGLIHGWSDNYLQVSRPSGYAQLGRIVNVEF